MPFMFTCDGCGAQFMRHTRTVSCDRVFCSQRCYWNARRQPLPTRDCLHCGHSFDPRSLTSDGRRRNPNNKYCSSDCYNAKRANPVTKTCPVCHKVFTIAKGAIAHRYNVCSVACKTRDTKYVDCERCGKRFRAEKRLNRHYCSESCRRPPVYADCRTCGKQFRRLPSALDRQFCALACYRAFVGENRLEARVRETLERLGVAFVQEASVGRWSIDFLLTDLGIALEADGAYWHKRIAERDARRDAELMRRGLRVVRLPEVEVNDADDLDAYVGNRIELATTATAAGM